MVPASVCVLFSIKFNVPYVCWGYFTSIFTVGDSYVLQHSRQLRCRLHPDVRDFYRPQSRTSILWSTVQPTSAVSALLVPHMSALTGELLTGTYTCWSLSFMLQTGTGSEDLRRATGGNRTGDTGRSSRSYRRLPSGITPPTGL